MIKVESLKKTFTTQAEDVAAIRDVSFEVATGEIITLLGPSGCGKTTTLRCIAGLERPTSGRITIGERTVVDCAANTFVPPNRRDLGMVFQSYAVWPHFTVLQNVAYALEGRRLDKATMRARAMEALDTVQMAHLADRPAPRLSGGQQQRVAIARALVGRPQALLFDEPLSNLDAKLRVEMRKELRRLQRQIGLTSVYVTHDQAEALAISDWIIVMKDGGIVEHGRPTDIYRTPRHVFTAQFVGTTNLIPGTLEAAGPGGGYASVATPFGRFIGFEPTATLKTGDKVQLSVRPEDIRRATPQDVDSDDRHPPLNRLTGSVILAIFAGSTVEADVRCAETTIHCLLDLDANAEPGARADLVFKPQATLVLADA